MSKNSKESALGEAIKKVVGLGVGAAFMTEDAIKSVLGDLPISKDIVAGLLSNAKNAKNEFIGTVKEELHSRLNSIDPKELVADVLSKYDVEVNAKISFKRKPATSGKKEK